MSKQIQFPARVAPATDSDIDKLNILDAEITTRVDARTRIAEHLLDQLAAGKVYAAARRDAVKTPAGAVKEYLVIGSEIRYQRIAQVVAVVPKPTTHPT